MQNLAESVLASVFALGCGIAAILGDLTPAMARQSYAQQSFLYPPEVRSRPVVVAPEPALQRRYWDPRYGDLYRAVSGRCGCLPQRMIR